MSLSVRMESFTVWQAGQSCELLFCHSNNSVRSMSAGLLIANKVIFQLKYCVACNLNIGHLGPTGSYSFFLFFKHTYMNWNESIHDLPAAVILVILYLTQVAFIYLWMCPASMCLAKARCCSGFGSCVAFSLYLLLNLFVFRILQPDCPSLPIDRPYSWLDICSWHCCFFWWKHLSLILETPDSYSPPCDSSSWLVKTSEAR